MHFATSALALMGSAAVASAASVTFWTLDDAQRTVYFTGNPGSAAVEPVKTSPGKNTTVTLPDIWVGNFYAVQDGQENIPGMLGELALGQWLGISYFDVSGIVNPHDQNNVKQIWPAEGAAPMSGCAHFPCNNAYWAPNDVQTKTTQENEFITTLGNGVTGLSFAEEA